MIATYMYCNYRRVREKQAVRLIKETWEDRQKEKREGFEKFKAERAIRH